MDDFFDNWTVQVRKGVLELCILNALAEKERYGYELVKTLVAIPGLGVTEGTLYPLLSRLRVQGFISARLEESSEGPARKYYALTGTGPRDHEGDERIPGQSDPRHAQAAGKEHDMSQWTDAARAKLEDYLGRMRQSLAASGADVNEVTDDLRRHVDEEAAARKLAIVTEQDVAQILAQIGAPEAPAAVNSAPAAPPPACARREGRLSSGRSRRGCCCSSASSSRSARSYSSS